MDKRIEELRNLNLELEELKKRKEEIKRKALEHRSTITSDEVDEARAEVENINQKIAECEARQEELKKENQGEQRKMNDYLQNNEKRDAIIASFKKEKRVTIPAQEVRSVLVASAGIAKPTKVNGIGEPFNTQVSILDQVQVVDMTGAGAFKESFLRTHSAAATKSDGVAQDESKPTFGTVTISPAEVAVTTYVSKELEKVTPLNYLEKVQRSALTALKVKLAGDIVAKIKVSVDDAETPVAMFQTLEASAANKMLTGSSTKTGAITESTLRNIVLSYGGDANVYGNAVLYLNKKDLIAFGDVRGTNEKKAVYEITPDPTNPNIGIIKDGGLSVPYCIVPTLTELSGKEQTSTAIQTMIYGSPMNFELALFGDYTIEVSRDYKFAEGLISVLGSVTAGGNVIVPNGFVVVTIPATE